MTFYLADRTLAAINSALEADQGARFRELEGDIIPTLKDAFNPHNEDARGYIGASQIGRECAREIWQSFHWVGKQHLSAKTIRLFNRGHLEEGRFLALLRMIGCQVFWQDSKGRQIAIVGANGHFGGHLDCVIKGIPELPDQWILGEFKTHNAESFTKLTEMGVRDSKFEHYVQMICYMEGQKLQYGLYCAVNKNTDDLYFEIILANPELARQFFDRADQIAKLKEPPPKLSESPGYYKCKMCSHHSICHKGIPVAKNCRTCKHSLVVDDGYWKCGLDDWLLNSEDQRKGCEKWEKLL